MVYQNIKRNIANNVDGTPVQQKIAMLTDIIENDESKCAIYFAQGVDRVMCFLNNDERRHKDCQMSQTSLDKFFSDNSEWFDLAEPGQLQTTIITDQPDNKFPQYQFNFFAVKTVACKSEGGYTIRKMHCLYHTYEPAIDGDCPEDTDHTSYIQKIHAFVVYHYWFPYWPDHRSPENIDVVLDMCINLIDADSEQEFNDADEEVSVDDGATRLELAKDTVDVRSSRSSLAPSTGPSLIIHW